MGPKDGAGGGGQGGGARGRGGLAAMGHGQAGLAGRAGCDAGWLAAMLDGWLPPWMQCCLECWNAGWNAAWNAVWNAGWNAAWNAAREEGSREGRPGARPRASAWPPWAMGRQGWQAGPGCNAIVSELFGAFGQHMHRAECSSLQLHAARCSSHIFGAWLVFFSFFFLKHRARRDKSELNGSAWTPPRTATEGTRRSNR